MEGQEMILRDYLALDRTKLANQRTLLAFVRTSLYLVVSGIAVIKVDFLEKISFLGFILVGVSLIVLILGIWNYFHFRKKMMNQYRQE
jgi:putative membrane protein